MFLDQKRRINFNLIRETLKKGYEIHFIRQEISIRNMVDLKKNIKKFIIFSQLRTRNFLDKVFMAKNLLKKFTFNSNKEEYLSSSFIMDI